MSGNSFGSLFRITTFGESHGPGLGVVIDGIPSGLPLSEAEVQRELDRRKPGQSSVTTARKESDEVHFLSGTFEGKTTGTPLAMVLYNADQRSEAYEPIKSLYRPGHADYTYHEKYGIRDWRGSGRASGRETASRVAAGAVAKKLLGMRNIEITAYTLRAAGVSCERRDLSVIEENPMRACDAEAAEKMATRIEESKEIGDSFGGVVECRVTGVPAGIGEPVFAKLDAELARAVVSLGAVKGIEFGAGFAAADMRGSEHNDSLGKRGHLSNHSGGIVGGISNGEELIFRAAIKPTSSISLPQETIDTDGAERTIVTEGRHDPCICPRIVPVVEAMTALVLTDLIMQDLAFSSIMGTEEGRWKEK